MADNPTRKDFKRDKTNLSEPHKTGESNTQVPETPGPGGSRDLAEWGETEPRPPENEGVRKSPPDTDWGKSAEVADKNDPGSKNGFATSDMRDHETGGSNYEVRDNETNEGMGGHDAAGPHSANRGNINKRNS